MSRDTRYLLPSQHLLLPTPPTVKIFCCKYGGPRHPLPKCDAPDPGKEQTFPTPGRRRTRQYLRASRKGCASSPVHRIALSCFSAHLLFSPFSLAQLPQPAHARPTDEQFWMTDQHGRRKPNSEFLRDHFIHEGRLTEEQALVILRQCTDMLTSEPNVLKVRSPVTGMSPRTLIYVRWELKVVLCSCW